MPNSPLFYQLFEAESSTYTYLLADQNTLEAILIDPVIETIERDLTLIQELHLKLKYVLDTHVHADHVTSAGEIRKRLSVQTGVSEQAAVECSDLKLKEGQKLNFGQHQVEVIETPGHTSSCLTYKVGDLLFTGDALLIRGNGRTDFQEGSSEKLYESIQKLYQLKGDFIIYPAHDYRGQTKSTLELEKKYNPRLAIGKTKEQFIQTMNELKLAHPKKIMEALPANKNCGLKKSLA